MLRGVLCLAAVLTTAGASAQDVFELEVFPYETLAPGRHEVEIHTNGIPGGVSVVVSPAAGHRPVHLSGEVTRGWTPRLDTAVFIQTTPFGRPGTTRFAGGHVRAKVRLTDHARLPFRIGLSAEYAFNRAALDDELQTLELRPILDRRAGRLSLIANPGMEMALKGPEELLAPSFDLAARAGWALDRGVEIFGEYFSKSPTTRHLQEEPGAHHLLFSGVDLDVGGGLEMSIGLGHCTTSDEPWVVKSIVGFSF